MLMSELNDEVTLSSSLRTIRMFRLWVRCDCRGHGPMRDRSGRSAKAILGLCMERPMTELLQDPGCYALSSRDNEAE